MAKATDGITLVFADEMWSDDTWMERALEALGPTVYLTFDVDYFDPVSRTEHRDSGARWWRVVSDPALLAACVRRTSRYRVRRRRIGANPRHARAGFLGGQARLQAHRLRHAVAGCRLKIPRTTGDSPGTVAPSSLIGTRGATIIPA